MIERTETEFEYMMLCLKGSVNHLPVARYRFLAARAGILSHCVKPEEIPQYEKVYEECVAEIKRLASIL